MFGHVRRQMGEKGQTYGSDFSEHVQVWSVTSDSATLDVNGEGMNGQKRNVSFVHFITTILSQVGACQL